MSKFYIKTYIITDNYNYHFLFENSCSRSIAEFGKSVEHEITSSIEIVLNEKENRESEREINSICAVTEDTVNEEFVEFEATFIYRD